VDNDTTGGGNPVSQFGRQGIDQVVFDTVSANDEFALLADTGYCLYLASRSTIITINFG